MSPPTYASVLAESLYDVSFCHGDTALQKVPMLGAPFPPCEYKLLLTEKNKMHQKHRTEIGLH